MTSPTIGGRSVGIVRSRTQTMEFSFFSSLVWAIYIYIYISSIYIYIYTHTHTYRRSYRKITELLSLFPLKTSFDFFILKNRQSMWSLERQCNLHLHSISLFVTMCIWVTYTVSYFQQTSSIFKPICRKSFFKWKAKSEKRKGVLEDYKSLTTLIENKFQNIWQ
jgi:hypothetical protein